MENILLKYMEDRFSNANVDKKPASTHKPVITLSRDFGCPARDVTRMSIESLNALKGGNTPVWSMISKEVLHEAAKELDMNPSKIKFIIDAKEKTVFDDIVDSLKTRKYKSDRTIRNTYADILKKMASQGNLFVLGMGAASILSTFPNVLNIKMTGPFDWRVQNIVRWMDISVDEARKLTIETDATRNKTLSSFLPPKQNEPHFDLIIDCMNIGTSEIVEMITGIVRNRLVH